MAQKKLRETVNRGEVGLTPPGAFYPFLWITRGTVSGLDKFKKITFSREGVGYKNEKRKKRNKK